MMYPPLLVSKRYKRVGDLFLQAGIDISVKIYYNVVIRCSLTNCLKSNA